MASLFIDLDGTLLRYGTNIPIEGAVEYLQQAKKDGHQIIITTYREMIGGDEIIGKIKEWFGPETIMLFGIQSPRIVFNDDGAKAVNHPRNGKWNYPRIRH